MRRILLLGVIMTMVLPPALLGAAAIDGPAVIENMKKAFEPGIASTRKVVFTLRKGDTVTNQWVAREGRKKFEDGKRALLIWLEPEMMKGIAYLMWERNDLTNVKWVYPPALGRIRQISGITAYDSFFSTDFTYADIGFLDISGTHKLLAEENHEGKNAYRVETIPDHKMYYSKIITWASTENFLPIQRDYYDAAGKLWKHEVFEKVNVINNVPMALQIRMTDVQAETSTEYEVSEVCVAEAIPDEIFSPQNLPNALAAPFCPVSTPTP